MNQNINTLKYIEEFVKIRDKNGNIIPFILNEPQQRLYDIVKKQNQQGKPIRIIILKARQMGFSTLTEALIFKNTATKKNINSGIITHIEDATTNLFNMSKLMYELLPEELRPQIKASNAKELIFDTKDGNGLKSKIKCMTAGSQGVGRSSTINYLHISEYAFWQGDKQITLNGLMQAVPNTPNSMVVIESTANGYDDFRKLWYMAVNGESDYEPLFVGWNELKDYNMPYSGFDLTPYEKEIKDRYKLSLEQLTWRRWAIKNNCGGDENLFRQEYPITPEEAFLSTGEHVFDNEILAERLEQIQEPLYVGDFEYTRINDVIKDIKFVCKKDGAIKIYKMPEDTSYAIGGDTSGDGSDFFTGQVVDKHGNQVAVLKQQFDEDRYAEQMYCLGRLYKWALMGIEVNFSTFPIKELQRLKYPNMFYRIQEDSISHNPERKYGFRTTLITRPLIISSLVRIVREESHTINDRESINEMLTFVRNEKGKPEAQAGYHDDLTMALAIAHYVREHLTEEPEKKIEEQSLNEVYESFYSRPQKSRVI